jgi:hypothetical protein
MAQDVQLSNHRCLLDKRKIGVEDDGLVIGASFVISNTDRIDHQDLCRAPSFWIILRVSRYRLMLSTCLFSQPQLWRSLAETPAFTNAIGFALPLSRIH